MLSANKAGWHDLERGAPPIARLGVPRLAAARVAMLGTLRADGSPRISPAVHRWSPSDGYHNATRRYP